MRRREFLSTSLHLGTGLAAIAVLGNRPLPAGPRSSIGVPRPVILVHSTGGDEPVATALRQALQRVGQQSVTELQLPPLAAFHPRELQQELRSRHGARLVCLMDTATGMVFDETLRDLGGKTICQGSHRGVMVPGGSSRHHFLTAPAAAGVGSVLAVNLQANATGFHITENMIADPGANPAPASRTGPSAHWTAALGTILAHVACGTWRPVQPAGTILSGTVALAASGVSLHSLVADI